MSRRWLSYHMFCEHHRSVIFWKRSRLHTQSLALFWRVIQTGENWYIDHHNFPFDVDMVNNHLCNESCFTARTADKLTIPCFVSDKKFYSKCFDLSSPQTMKVLSPASYAVFMCHKCIDRVTQWKQNRRSNDATTASNSTKTNDQAHHIQNELQQDQSILSTLLSRMKTMDEKFSLLLHSNETKYFWHTYKPHKPAFLRKRIFES